MSKIKKLIEELPAKLKESQASAIVALDEILEFILEETSPAARSNISFNTLARICINFTESRENFQIYLKCLLKLIPELSEEIYKKSLIYINRFNTVALQNEDNKNKIREFIPTLPEINLSEITDEETIIYLEHIERLYLNLIFANPQPNELKFNFRKFGAIYQVVCQKFPKKFIEITLKTFSQKAFLNLMYCNLEHSKLLFETYFELLKKCDLDEIESSENYMNLTSLLIDFIRNDRQPQSTDKFATFYLNSFLSNQQILKPQTSTSQYFKYSLTIYCYLLKNNVQKNSFAQALELFEKMLDRNEFTNPLYIDSALTFTQILLRISSELIGLKEPDFLITFRILEKLLKIFETFEIPKNKQICKICSQQQEHFTLDICTILTEFSKKFMQSKFQDKNFDEISIRVFTKMREFTKHAKCINFENQFVRIIHINYKLILSHYENYSCLASELIEIIIAIRPEHLNKVNLLKALKIIQKNDDSIENLEKLIEINALLAGNLILDVNSQLYCEGYLANFINCSNKLGRNFSLICDVIEMSKYSSLKPIRIERKKLSIKQYQISTKYNLISPPDCEKFTIEILRLSNDNPLEIVQALSNLKKINSKEILERLTKLLQETQKKISEKPKVCDATQWLIAGYLFKINTMQEFESLKNPNTKFKKFSEDILNEIEIDEFDKFQINIELKAVKLAEMSLKYFDDFYKMKGADLKAPIDWECIFDSISMLARQLQLRGFFELASIAWKLLNEFAKQQNSFLNEVRAFSFFCENCDVITNYDIKENLNSISQRILDNFKQLDDLTPRKQNYIMICILNISYYYAKQNDLQSALALKNMVFIKLNETRKFDKLELVKAKCFALDFYLMLQYKLSSDCSALNLVMNILNELKSIKYLTSEDTINIPLFLYDFIQNIVYYFLNTSNSKLIVPPIVILFMYSFDNGLPYKMAEILALWATVNLENEDPLYCQTKLIILNRLMENEQNIATPLVANDEFNLISTKENFFNPTDFFGQANSLEVEQTRRRAISPLNFKMPVSVRNVDLSIYLPAEHKINCSCDFCEYSILKFLNIKIGCCYARMFHFHSSSVDNCRQASLHFYEKSLQFWLQLNSNTLKLKLHNNFLLMLVHYINTLRGAERYKKANEICELALHQLDKSKIDFGFYWKIVEQKESIDLILSQQQKSGISIKVTELLAKPNQTQHTHSPLENDKVSEIKKESDEPAILLPKTISENSVAVKVNVKKCVKYKSLDVEWKTPRKPNQKQNLVAKTPNPPTATTIKCIEVPTSTAAGKSCIEAKTPSSAAATKKITSNLKRLNDNFEKTPKTTTNIETIKRTLRSRKALID